ncbi:MAG: DUF3095 family protein [Saprospiraceae bacterium]
MSNQPATNQFYGDLPVYELPASQLIARREYFRPVPEDWHVIVTDIQHSTQAVLNGLQQVVNLVASGSIIAVLNIGRAQGMEIPFFFGGDGATMLVPPSVLEKCMQALVRHRENTMLNYQLNLRVGQVPVREVYQTGAGIVLARMRLGKKFAVPVVLGEGLKWAERTVKAGSPVSAGQPEAEFLLNLEGMECRWDRIKPPQNTPEVVCLLVEARDSHRHAPVFAKILETIDAVYGPPEARNPISVSRLKLKATPAKIAHEMRVKLGRFNLSYLLENFFYTFFGFVYFRFYQTGRTYLHQLVELADTLVLDGRINTVISGTSQQRQALCEALEKMEAAGECFYGLHVCRESIMSCYVRNRQDEHIHFVDGSQGGYTQAARILKDKLSRAASG